MLSLVAGNELGMGFILYRLVIENNHSENKWNTGISSSHRFFPRSIDGANFCGWDLDYARNWIQFVVESVNIQENFDSLNKLSYL